MNAVLSLAYNLESYLNCLYEAGYTISRIEPHINVNGGINPDILFMSAKRGLFAECKGGEYYIGANLEKYGQITTRHLVEKGIDITVETVELDVGIFGKENLEALKEKLEKEGIFYPQVVMNKFIQKKYGNDFKDPALQKLFSEPIEIKGKPLTILRFSKESSLKKIAPYIFKALMKRSIFEEDIFTTRELTEELVGEVWENLDNELKKALCNKVGQFLRHCKRNHLQRYLRKDEDTWKIKVGDHWKTRDRFRKDCRKTVKSLDQKTLFDYGARKN